MSESGDFELFGAPAAKEHDEKSDEQFREQMKRAQQQIAQLQKEEGHARAQDQNLVAIIIQFLSQPQNTDLFLLISRVIGQDIPSELILAIISLIDQRATQEVYAYLEAKEQAEKAVALTVHKKADFQALPPEHKKMIDEWIHNIHHVAAKRPQRVLESVVFNFKAAAYNPDAVREIFPSLVQLSAFILRNYLNYFKIEFEFENLHGFMQLVFVEMVKNLEALIQGQKQLGSSES
ncbi:hypothetical protein COY07_06500 [Candidatus Peregrinibacteria bacterium CG_4_10_14_0_2_um_filter_43_11]|nr:MAG: hypothetical protein COY07_06500 [Candidatus Peregrinibacteria bacterium CG_4_10_14_0_2_um_filter_43_11]